jgi:deoxyribose-phosphate aldolase
VILETCLLTPEQIATASTIAANAGADFVKTSTGFSTGGATLEAVTLMRKTVPARVQVKVREKTTMLFRKTVGEIGAISPFCAFAPCRMFFGN